MMHKHVAAWFMLFSAPVFAGTRVSGGGDVIVCQPAGGAPTYRLLDFYEAEILFNSPLKMLTDGLVDDPNARVQEKALHVLERLRQWSPVRYAFYKAEVDNFFVSFAHFTSESIRPIDDAHYNILPAHCSLEQLAMQQELATINDPTYWVNLPYWNNLSLDDRAGLLLHEIFYNEFLTYGHTDSLASRRLIGQLATDTFGGRVQNLVGFLVFLHSAHVPDTDIAGLWMRIWNFERDDDPLRSPQLVLQDGRISRVYGNIYPNFEATGYGLDNIFETLRTYNEFYVVRGTRVKVTAPRFSDRLSVQLSFDESEQLVDLLVMPSTGTVKMSYERAPGEWVETNHLRWNEAGQIH